LLFLPKMPAFWQLPGPKHAKTGLSEQVDPFDIAKLSNSDELVFRAQFNTSAPQSPLYWRAIIHDDFNGNAWLTSNYLKQNNTTTRFKAENNQIQAQYSIISEPAAQPWLYGLHYATSNSDGVENSALGVLRKTANSAKSIQYVATSFLVTEPELTAWQASHYTQLNNANNTKTNALADKLKRQVSSDKQFYTALLDHFAVKKFSYTLTPQPMTGDDTLDQFMFEQQRGFCGHYASAAAYMFRRAGIPARVVSGYLGGEFNSKSNTLSVRQYDAHAWVEVYLPSQGWQVFDATAVVAPERLTGSLSENDQLNAEFKHNLGFGLLSLSDVAAINWLRLQLENLDYQWSSWVLGFDKQKQSDFLKTLFGNQNTWLVPLVVLIVLVLSLSAYFIYLTWARPAKQLAPMVKEYRQIVKWANKLQLFPAHPLTPVQQLHFFAREIPEAEQQLHQFSLLFNQVRYENKPFNKDRKSQAKDLIKLIKSKKQRNL
uniref:transglutaminase family protein n=1 Tax=Pseudoalteromonas sp. TaxID=53249 RepID=UPI00356473CE